MAAVRFAAGLSTAEAGRATVSARRKRKKKKRTRELKIRDTSRQDAVREIGRSMPRTIAEVRASVRGSKELSVGAAQLMWGQPPPAVLRPRCIGPLASQSPALRA